MNTYATTELVRYRQAELVAEADARRLAAQARGKGAESAPAPWESRIGRVRHAFAAFATLPRVPDVRLTKSPTGA
jgi:hypothetical protein